jgi:regulator of cell morphogenesis and NO signaling
MLSDLLNQPVGAIAAAHHQATRVFSAHEIDFCCGGKRTLSEVCFQKGIDPVRVAREIVRAIDQSPGAFPDVQSWPPDLLADYIEKKHHRYVSEQIPVILQLLEKVNARHGDSHPELGEVLAEFRISAAELSMHMKKEELVLFPWFRRHALGQEVRQSVLSPIAVMRHEHDEEGARFRRISILTNGYTPPEDACQSYKAVYALLADFEADLHTHIHLENNVLFEKAV